MKIPRNLGGHFLNIKEGKDWKGFGWGRGRGATGMEAMDKGGKVRRWTSK